MTKISLYSQINYLNPLTRKINYCITLFSMELKIRIQPIIIEKREATNKDHLPPNGTVIQTLTATTLPLYISGALLTPVTHFSL